MAIYAGNLARITTTVTTLEPPAGTPTAIVCITTAGGTFIETIAAPDVTVNDNIVTVVADWEIPDDTAGGTYVATIDLDGSVIAADQQAIEVRQRTHTDPHPT